MEKVYINIQRLRETLTSHHPQLRRLSASVVHLPDIRSVKKKSFNLLPAHETCIGQIYMMYSKNVFSAFEPWLWGGGREKNMQARHLGAGIEPRTFHHHTAVLRRWLCPEKRPCCYNKMRWVKINAQLLKYITGRCGEAAKFYSGTQAIYHVCGSKPVSCNYEFKKPLSFSHWIFTLFWPGELMWSGCYFDEKALLIIYENLW